MLHYRRIIKFEYGIDMKKAQHTSLHSSYFQRPANSVFRWEMWYTCKIIPSILTKYHSLLVLSRQIPRHRPLFPPSCHDQGLYKHKLTTNSANCMTYISSQVKHTITTIHCFGLTWRSTHQMANINRNSEINLYTSVPGKLRTKLDVCCLIYTTDKLFLSSSGGSRVAKQVGAGLRGKMGRLENDNSLTLVPHITKVVRTCFGVLRQLRSAIRTLPRDVSCQLVQSFVLSHVDYCNAIFIGLPQREIVRLQAVVNAAARLISGVGKYDHITPVLRDVLHILRINQRIKFKLCLLVFKCLHNLAPQYLRDHINLLANDSGRKRLRSSKTLELSVPRTRTCIGDRSFRVAGLSAWNSLPPSVQEANPLGTLKQLLKTHLFRTSYPVV